MRISVYVVGVSSANVVTGVQPGPKKPLKPGDFPETRKLRLSPVGLNLVGLPAIIGLMGNIGGKPAIALAGGDSAHFGGTVGTEPGALDKFGAHGAYRVGAAGTDPSAWLVVETAFHCESLA